MDEYKPNCKLELKKWNESNVELNPSKKYVDTDNDYFTALLAINFVGKNVCYYLRKTYLPRSGNFFVFVSLFTETTS